MGVLRGDGSALVSRRGRGVVVLIDVHSFSEFQTVQDERRDAA